MRPIHLIVIHCSATRANRSYTVDDCRRDHRDRGYADIGYHYYIARDGEVHTGRPLSQVGAHARGFNKYSIGICYKVGWTTMVVRPIREHHHSAPVWTNSLPVLRQPFHKPASWGIIS